MIQDYCVLNLYGDGMLRFGALSFIVTRTVAQNMLSCITLLIHHLIYYSIRCNHSIFTFTRELRIHRIICKRGSMAPPTFL